MNASFENPIEIAPRITYEGYTGPVPVQIEGTIDGKRYYFRARFNAWSLSVHETAPGEYHTWPDDEFWRYEEFYGESGYDASWMPEDEAIAFIIKAAGEYRSHDKVAQSVDERMPNANETVDPPTPEVSFERSFLRNIQEEDGSAAREMLQAGRPVHIRRADTPPGHVIRIHPNGREELVHVDSDYAKRQLSER